MSYLANLRSDAVLVPAYITLGIVLAELGNSLEDVLSRTCTPASLAMDFFNTVVWICFVRPRIYVGWTSSNGRHSGAYPYKFFLTHKPQLMQVHEHIVRHLKLSGALSWTLTILDLRTTTCSNHIYLPQNINNLFIVLHTILLGRDYLCRICAIPCCTIRAELKSGTSTELHNHGYDFSTSKH